MVFQMNQVYTLQWSVNLSWEARAPVISVGCLQSLDSVSLVDIRYPYAVLHNFFPAWLTATLVQPG